LVTNDKHYNILKTIGFPPVNVISLEEFEEICFGGLKEQIIQGDNYQIKVDSDFLTIIFNNSLQEYEIYKNALTEILTGFDGSKDSNFILHLSGKTWISDKLSLLYDIAEITQTSFPLSGINWEETFYQVAYDAYIKKLKTDNEKSLVDSMLEEMEMYSEEISDIELMKNLKEGVREELRKRKII
jgi:hypothetical protein